MDMKRDIPDCDQCDKNDDDFPYPPIDPQGFMKVDMLATKGMRGEEIIAPPDSSIRYFIGMDPGPPSPVTVIMGQFYPDGFWPPINTINAWQYFSADREIRRENKRIRRLYRQYILLTVAVCIFWALYGADQVLR
jgi:hypothetical protein